MVFTRGTVSIEAKTSVTVLFCEMYNLILKGLKPIIILHLTFYNIQDGPLLDPQYQSYSANFKLKSYKSHPFSRTF